MHTFTKKSFYHFHQMQLKIFIDLISFGIKTRVQCILKKVLIALSTMDYY